MASRYTFTLYREEDKVIAVLAVTSKDTLKHRSFQSTSSLLGLFHLRTGNMHLEKQQVHEREMGQYVRLCFPASLRTIVLRSIECYYTGFSKDMLLVRWRVVRTL